MNDSSTPDTETQVLGRHLYCEEELGFAWTVVEALPDSNRLVRLNSRNEVVLRTLALVEEHDETQSDDAERAEFHRLEAKLNMVLELVAELVANREGAVPTRRIRFNSAGFCWHGDEELAPDTLLSLEFYAQPAWPVPLKLFARVVRSSAVGARFRTCAQLEAMSDGPREWLEKLVFRRHRQAIAQRRSAE